MDNIKTTIVLVAVLLVEILWLFPAKESAAASGQTSEPPQPTTVTAPPQRKAPTPAPPARQESSFSSRRHLTQLEETKTKEEQELYLNRLVNAFTQSHLAIKVRYIGNQSSPPDEIEKQLVRIREKERQNEEENFKILEDYILNTEFTELTDEEMDKVLEFYSVRKRAHEARENMFETPIEEWIELAKANDRLMIECRPLLMKQYDADFTQSLGDALKNYCTVISDQEISATFTSADGTINNIHIKGHAPSGFGFGWY